MIVAICGQEDGFTTKMQGLVLKLFLLAGLFTISLAQCSGSFSNTTQQVSLDWTVLDDNTVNFIYTAPSTNTQYTALAFSNQLITSIENLANVDAVYIYAGDNGADSFVQDRWVPNVFSNQLDTEQNLEDTSATLSDGFLTVNFTRPIISPDKNQDLDLNTCQYVVYVFNGAVLGSFESPTGFNIPTGFGLFLMQLCLQNCQDSPSVTTTIMPTPIDPGVSTEISSPPSTTTATVSSPTPSITPSATPNNDASRKFASALLVILALVLAIHAM